MLSSLVCGRSDQNYYKMSEQFKEDTGYDRSAIPGKRHEKLFREAYERYWDNMFIQAYKVLKDRSVSEDITQEIFTDLWEKKSLFRIDNLEAYLYQSVKFKVLKELRKDRVRQEHESLVKAIKNEADNVQNNDSAELREEILQQMENLPEKCRSVFYKSRFEDTPNREIAREMGISVRTVETHISHALKLLRKVRRMMQLFFL